MTCITMEAQKRGGEAALIPDHAGDACGRYCADFRPPCNRRAVCPAPAIDSVGLSLEGMGGKVMDLLEERRENPNAPSRHLEIHTDYVSRGTVTAPKTFIQRPGE